jgi:hypothetical protein
LGEKFIEMDNWKYESTEVTIHLYHDLAVNEETLKKLRVVVQDTKKSPSISTTEASTITEENMVNSPSNTLGEFGSTIEALVPIS